MQIETLYEDDSFNDLLVNYATNRGIYAFDDYKQDVFLAIIEDGVQTRSQCTRIADKIAKRYSRTDSGDDIMHYAYSDDEGNTESDDEIMSRLVYEGKARKVG